MSTLYEPLLTCRGPGASDASTIEAGFDDFVHVNVHLVHGYLLDFRANPSIELFEDLFLRQSEVALRKAWEG
jgi:hypothetical protein